MNRYIFTIRDMLWLTVVVAMGATLVVERQRAGLWNRRGAAAFRALEDAELEPTWDGDRLLVHPPIINPPPVQLLASTLAIAHRKVS